MSTVIPAPAEAGLHGLVRRSQQAPLWVKLLGILLAVLTVGIVVVYSLVVRAVEEGFRAFSNELGTAHVALVEPRFAAYYADHGSWEGVQPVLTASIQQGHHEMILADASGRIIAASDPRFLGRELTSSALQRGQPIVVGGERVGTLLAGTVLNLLGASQQDFIDSVKRATLGAGLAAALVALLLGWLFVRQLTRPLREMAAAAEAVAAGELGRQVAWSGHDEVGRLADSFNRMTTGLARSERLRQDMAADIAHELRNPLAIIRADLQALADGIYPLTPERIASIDDEARLLERLVEDLRTLSLADAGELKLHRQPVDLADLVGRVAGELRPAFEAKQVALDLGLPPDPLVLWLDPDRVRQVLMNLLRNAEKYTPSGGQVRVAVEPAAPDAARVTVRDTGLGIAAADLPFLFERFWRADRSRSRQSGGTGLGLPIARKLTEAHGGQILVESTEGVGTTFTVLLPTGAGTPRPEPTPAG